MPRASLVAILSVAALSACLVARAQAPDQAAGADEQASAQAEVHNLKLHAAAEPMPAFRYRLIPPAYERQPGNAADLYKAAAALLVEQKAEDALGKVDQWGDMPLEDLPRQETKETFAQFSAVLGHVESGAWSEQCEWEPVTGPDMPLPDLGQYRRIARLLAPKARVEILDHDYARAVRTLETGLSFAHDVGRGPTLIHGLVGVGTASLMLDVVEEFIQTRDAPSLYWALTALPSPLVDLRPAAELELGGMLFWPKELRDPENAGLSASEWVDAFGRLGEAAMGDFHPNGDRRAAVAAVAAVAYTDAKRHLLEKGVPAEKVEAMPVLQAVAIYLCDGWRRSADEALKWWYTPYPEARTDAGRLERIAADAAETKDGFMVALLMPALGRVRQAQVKLERRIAALRAVEAVRLHAGAAQGRLPARLADVRQAPVPPDPATGESFAYRLEGQRAVLSGPADGMGRPDTGIRYEIEITK